MPAATRPATSMATAPARPAARAAGLSDEESNASSTGADHQHVTRSQLRVEIAAAAESQASGIRIEFRQQRRETDVKFEELGHRMDAKFEEQGREIKEHGQRLDRFARMLQAHARITRAKEANRSATHLYSRVEVVIRYDYEDDELSEPWGFPERVGAFWRLKKPSGWESLARLHEFYGTTTWFEWGLGSLDPDSEDDEDVSAPPHQSLREAVSFAPDIALQELAQHLGLDYDKICANVVEDVRIHRTRSAVKRSLAPQPTIDLSKRPKIEPRRHEEAERLSLEDLIGKPDYERTESHRSIKTPSTQLGWDPLSNRGGRSSISGGGSSDSGRRSRNKDPTPSPTSVATSNADLRP